MPAINFSGINSGLDTASIVQQLLQIERRPIDRLTAQRQTVQQRQESFRTLDTRMSSLRTAARALSDVNRVLVNQATSTDESKIKATAGTAAIAGSYRVDVVTRASNSVFRGATNIGGDVDLNSELKDRNSLGSGFVGGRFTIDGRQFTVEDTETLQSVINKINTEFAGSITASIVEDRFVLQKGSGNIVLGSGGDTSNILSQLKLNANGFSSTVQSSSRLGGLDITSVIDGDGNADGLRARLDPISGPGAFSINGVTIEYDTTSESLGNIIGKINSSAAGVTAKYDKLLDQIVLTNKEGGATGINIQDVTGNLAAALGLADPSANLQLGNNAEILIEGINDGNPIFSSDNVFTEAETGIVGVTLDVKSETQDFIEIDISPDNDAVVSKFDEFIKAYNDLQKFIRDQSKVTNTSRGPLAGDGMARSIANTLRSTVASAVASISAGSNTLAGLGITTEDQSPTLKFDKEKLRAAISGDPNRLKQIVGNSDGIMNRLVSYVDSQTLFGDGPLATKPANLDSSIKRINDSIKRMNLNLARTEERLRARFNAMERTMGRLQDGLGSLLTRLS